jgi:hypothetical protein
MLTDFHKWEENREETMVNQEIDNEGQLNEEQQPEFNINGTALNEL